jgi:3-deoxy-7-phosphoheptulonate synthase
VAYDAIGARNTTDQKAREYGSGSSSPVGFKNTPEGSIVAAAEAVKAANAPHSFLGIARSGLPMRVRTLGNEDAHIILRGDANGPNYGPEHITRAKEILGGKNLLEAIVIDASHGNTLVIGEDGKGRKDYRKQLEVVSSVHAQLAAGELAIKGVMLESNLRPGSQDIKKTPLEYGVSVTDGCIGLDSTAEALEILAEAVRIRREAVAA